MHFEKKTFFFFFLLVHLSSHSRLYHTFEESKTPGICHITGKFFQFWNWKIPYGQGMYSMKLILVEQSVSSCYTRSCLCLHYN